MRYVYPLYNIGAVADGRRCAGSPYNTDAVADGLRYTYSP